MNAYPPVEPPLAPMLAKSVPRVPMPDTVEGGLLYEPKWDGFRCIVFKNGDDVVLGSRNEKPLTRYFPELVDAAREQLADRVVLDGEIVVVQGERLEFERLLDRIHPAASRVERLARETPASFVAFDLLASGEESWLDRSRTTAGLSCSACCTTSSPPFHVTPATTDPDLAQRWFDQFEGAGLDGVVAKPRLARYQPDKRALFKVKHGRTADCVVAGYRWHKSGQVVGSLLLGLYDESGALHHVGVAASFTMARRAELVDQLAAYRLPDVSEHPWASWADADSAGGNPSSRMPGGQTRWNSGKDLSWGPLRPELVCEVAYDQLQGDRFRHTAQFRHWRPDRSPTSCTYAQLDQPVRYDLREVLGGR